MGNHHRHDQEQASRSCVKEVNGDYLWHNFQPVCDQLQVTYLGEKGFNFLLARKFPSQHVHGCALEAGLKGDAMPGNTQIPHWDPFKDVKHPEGNMLS